MNPADAAWEERLAAHWATLDDANAEVFIEQLDALLGAWRPPVAIAHFERAAAQDSTGHPDLAVPLYEAALGAGLAGPRRRRAVI